MNEKELYIKLGLGLSTSFGLETPKNEHALIYLAKTWYDENRNKIVEKICSSKIIKKYLDANDTSKKTEIIAAIADIIAESWIGIPPFVLSVLIFKEGVEKICK